MICAFCGSFSVSEKTEQPTPKRLREAREKGDVCKSQDVPAALSVLAIAVYLVAMSESIFETLSVMTLVPMDLIARPFSEALPLAAQVTVDCFLKLTLPVLGLVMAVSIVSNLAQVGVLFAFKGAVPKLENISPSKWFQKVFCVKNAVEFLKNVLKVTVLALVAWKVMDAHLKMLFSIPNGNIGHLWEILGRAAKDLLFAAAGAFCVIAALDYLFQRWQYTKQHMMSKDEVKREYKEMEGDPLIKSKRKQLHQEMAAQNTLGNVRKAKVVVTNPTHIAVALDYEKDTTPLPIIVAKGEGLLAQRMMEIAREEGIPVMQNVPLARGLFEQGAENAYIPKELIGPVAEVLRWVQSLQRN
jgi:type III secretion protein U